LQKLKHAHESIDSFACKNETLETETHSYKSKRKEFKKSLHSITVERDCFKKQAVDLEELFESASSEERVSNQQTAYVFLYFLHRLKYIEEYHGM
jgi:hypothetical protein